MILDTMKFEIAIVEEVVRVARVVRKNEEQG